MTTLLPKCIRIFSATANILLSSYCLVSPAKSQLVTDLSSLGFLEFEVDTSSTTANHRQTVEGVVFEGYQPLGSTMGGFWLSPSPFNWAQYSLSSFALLMSVVGENPDTPFSLELYDDNLRTAVVLGGSTFGLSEVLSLTMLSLTSVGQGSMSNIRAAQFTWDAETSVNATWAKIAAVPEPNIFPLLLLATLLLLLSARRSRRIVSENVATGKK